MVGCFALTIRPGKTNERNMYHCEIKSNSMVAFKVEMIFSSLVFEFINERTVSFFLEGITMILFALHCAVSVYAFIPPYMRRVCVCAFVEVKLYGCHKC